MLLVLLKLTHAHVQYTYYLQLYQIVNMFSKNTTKYLIFGHKSKERFAVMGRQAQIEIYIVRFTKSRLFKNSYINFNNTNINNNCIFYS